MKKILEITGVIFIVLIATSIFSEKKDSTTKDKVKINVTGKPINTGYFEVTVHGAKLTKEVKTGNRYSDLPSQDGILYLTLDISFKNIDKESRYITSGDLLLYLNNQEYVYDKSETILANGYNSLESINPFLSLRTKIVYKIPSEHFDKIYYEPGRTKKGRQIIQLF